MAFKASNITPQKAYLQVKGTAVNLKANCQGFIAQLAAQNATYLYLRDIYRFLYNANAQFETLKATPGLAVYAQEQENDPAYNVAAEFTAMQATIANALSWMNTNIPTAVTAVSASAWATGDETIATSFTPAQTATFRTVLTAIVNSIE